MVGVASMIALLSMFELAAVMPDGDPGRAAPMWKAIRMQTACEAMLDDYCLGRYGFTVRNDGSYTAGPAPDGRKLEGRISPGELQRLNRLTSKFSADGAMRDESSAPPVLPGIRDQIDIEFAGASMVRVYETGGRARKTRHQGNWEDAVGLRDHVRELLEHYYPHPFPAKETPGAH